MSESDENGTDNANVMFNLSAVSHSVSDDCVRVRSHSLSVMDNCSGIPEGVSVSELRYYRLSDE